MTHHARLTAPLFDKLTGEGTPDRFTERALRDTVRRDLAALLNTTNLAAAMPLDDHPEVGSSVLNFGVPDLAGKAIAHRVVLARAREIRQALRAFEPRLDEGTLAVEPAPQRERENAITFVVTADVRSGPVPMPVRFRTDVETDGAGVTVRD